MDPEQLPNQAPPVVVYLDNRDYSLMSDPNCKPENQEALTRLLALVDAGRAVVPFSCMHVAEMCPDRSSDPQLALLRLELMERLSGGATLKHPAKIIVAEDADGFTAGREHTIGSWLYDPDQIKELHVKGAVALTALFASLTVRHREAIAQRCDSGELLTIPPQAQSAFASTMTQSEMRSFVRSALNGDVNAIAELHGKRLRQPSMMARLSAALGLPSGLAQQFDYLSNGAHQFLLNGQVRWKPFTKNSEFQKRLRRMPQDSHVQDLIGQLAPGISVSDAKRQRGATVMTQVLLELYSMTAGQGREPDFSDGGDMLHAFYSPYVDVFSCDKRMEPILKRLVPNARSVKGGPKMVVAAIEAIAP